MTARLAGFAGLACVIAAVSAPPVQADGLQRLAYNHPGLTVDLGVGLWAFPLPMDWDGDGDIDLVVTCPDTPYSGTYFFENPGSSPRTPGQGAATAAPLPVFKPAVKVGPAINYATVSHINGQPRVLTPGTEWLDFRGKEFKQSRKIYPKTSIHPVKVRANQWSYADYDGDGDQDLIVGVGDWTEYGWDNAFNPQGQWTRGPLHGYVYLVRNDGSDAKPAYAEPVKVSAGDQNSPVDVFGRPSPNFGDFDSDGDLDLLCGEFLDGFTYFQNVGSRTAPRYAAGRRLTCNDRELKMDLEMIVPSAIDFDRDGDLDLVVGDEDGRVAFVEHTGKIVDGLPQFALPRYFQQEAADVKFGALATPIGVDWDGDGDEDIVSGNTAGYIGFIENLGGNPRKWAAPVHLKAGDEVIRIMAGENGSIQGPAEAKWGYTTISVVDWDHDGLLDVVANSIWGKIVWYRNTGTKTAPKLAAAAEPVMVQWPSTPPKPAWNWWSPKPGELTPQWRTTPVVHDWTGDGLNDLSMLDHEGYLSLFRREKRDGKLVLLPGERRFVHAAGPDAGKPMQLNPGIAGKSGRRKLSVTDWDGDGKPDLLINGMNATLLRNVSTDKETFRFEDAGNLDTRKLAGHDTSPTTVDWDGDGVRDLLIGAEDGYFYYMKNPAPPKTP